MLIKNLLGVSNSFSRMKKHKAILNISATLLHQPNLTLITANVYIFYGYAYSENAI